MDARACRILELGGSPLTFPLLRNGRSLSHTRGEGIEQHLDKPPSPLVRERVVVRGPGLSFEVLRLQRPILGEEVAGGMRLKALEALVVEGDDGAPER